MRRAFLLCIICTINGAQGTVARAQGGQQPGAAQEAGGGGDAKRPAAKDAPARKTPQTPERVSAERILHVLRTVTADSKDWKNAAAAAGVQAQVADLVWELDPISARAFLTQAWETAARVNKQQKEASRFRNNSPRVSVAREVISVARKRAPELAEKWLEELAEEDKSQPEKGDTQRGVFDDRTRRSTVLLQLALASVERDPQAAAELATESLQDGVSFGLQQVLLKLQEKKFEYARRVFAAALARLRVQGMSDPNELLILYSYLYTPGTVFGANTSDNSAQGQMSKGRNPVTVKSAAEVDPALALEFLRLASDLLLNAPAPVTTADPQLTARTQISVIGTLMGKLSQALPDRAVALQNRVQQMESDAQFVSSSGPAQAETSAAAGDGQQNHAERRVDRLEEEASKETDPLRRDVAYARAALATAAEKYERGVSLADKIRDDSLRRNISGWLYTRASLHFVDAGNFDKAYELLRKSGEPSQKSTCLVVGAQKLSRAKDPLRAAQWLQEARAIIKSAEPDEAVTRVALGVVSAYAQFDQAEALAAFDDAVKLMNQSPPASAADEKAPLVKRFSGFASADYTHGTEGFGLNAAVGAFRAAWFDSVLSTLDKISDVELRGSATVTLCRKAMPPKAAAANTNN